MNPPNIVSVLDEGGEQVSTTRVILGGRFGEESEHVSFQRLDRFAAGGGRLVETAHSYADGRSEEIIGRWLQANPGSVGVVDKVGHPDHEGILDLSRDRVDQEAEESCRRLGLPAIDVLLLHRDDPSRSVSELAETLLGLVHAGYARRVGVSNWSADRLAQLAALLNDQGQVPVASYHFSLAVPVRPLWPGTLHAADDVMAVVNRYGLPLLAWAAQARGFFAGLSEPLHDGLPDPFDTAENREKRERCVELAKRLDCRPEVVALAWTLHHNRVWPIVGPRSIDELDVSLAATLLPLDEVAVRWLRDGHA